MSSSTEFSIRSQRVVTPQGISSTSVWVRDGKIQSVQPQPPSGIPCVDVGGLALLPGIVDTHAHINEPGRTEWEGFETATRAAAAGGITTVIDMPLNSIPATTSLRALEIKATSAQGHCTIDYGFWGGVVPGNASELEPMIRAGAFGFKAFLCPSGVDEFPMSTEQDLRQAMPILARNGIPLLVHAEIEGHAPAARNTYRSYLDSRPPSWEVEAIRLVIRLARETRCRTHIVHLSASDALPDLLQARSEGIPITAETCPHYLSFIAEEIPDGATQFKCAPPIREKANRERLWEAIRQEQIEFIVSDHSPCTPALKSLETGDFGKAWGGIAGLQFSLPAVWTDLSAHGMGLVELSRLMSFNTSRFLGMSGKKGAIAPGQDADFVVFDPEATVVPQASQVLHRHSLTPYSGRKLRGRVQSTYLRGHKIFDHGSFDAAPRGTRLLRTLSGQKQ